MPEDSYQQAASLHVRCISSGFLSGFGTKFLALMYRAIDEDPESLLLLAIREGKVVGFVSGGVGLRRICMGMLRRPVALLGALLPSLLRPERLIGIAEIMRYASRSDSPKAKFPTAELLSIAVAPDWRGVGIAEELYLRLKERFNARGIEAFKIIVGDGLAPAHRFYRKMGAEPCAKVAVHGGSPATLYVQQIER